MELTEERHQCLSALSPFRTARSFYPLFLWVKRVFRYRGQFFLFHLLG